MGHLRAGARLLTVVVLLSASLVAASPVSAAEPAACTAPVPSSTKPGYVVADPDCDLNGTPFGPLTSADGTPLSRTWTGIVDGAAYRIEVPLRWNGELAVWAHGYRGQGATVYVDNPSLRAHYVARGFAWAASSYQTNGYDVGQGVRDSHAMIARFAAVTGKRARGVYMTGVSMGGHITAVAIEHYRGSFVGAMPLCGSIGDTELYDYFTDATVTAAALTGMPLSFPTDGDPGPAFDAAFKADVKAALPLLGSNFGVGVPPTLTDLGRTWGDAVERRSGGERPGFDSAFAYWNAAPGLAPNNDVPFLFGVYPGMSGGTAGIAPGNIVDNRLTWYDLDDRLLPSRAELRLNRDALRVARTATASRDLSGIPRVNGDPRIPVLSLHTIGDLFVPLSMEQTYALRAALHGQSRNVAQRAVRAVGHCEFTPGELNRTFDDLVTWVRTGRKAAGDALLNPREVARPTFGCTYTVGARPNFVAPACP
ncbi:alpha/beta hydrolase [Virgisporangium aliadipatigenens]|uniref:Alpha/beta hydrolase n=1 Tax=Virgisporangium aliadipatigenens TaxID=741659 RepID=A0A8J3YP94_9ACTN|nr:phthalyl amidase [Virgisporangium aliadipatigenens]GIJ47520.1 alpha/beta hydrolase [Virgisporangium aliadipatigenens]